MAKKVSIEEQLKETPKLINEIIDNAAVELNIDESAIDKENARTVEEFVNNKENKQKATTLAYQISQEYSNWFSVPQLLKKFKVTIPEAASQIEMLMLFNVCIGKVEKGKPYFKIDLTQKAQRQLILDEIAVSEGKVLFLKEKLAKLN